MTPLFRHVACGVFCAACIGSGGAANSEASDALDYGTRPLALVHKMTDGPLKTTLLACADQTPSRTDFSIAHRGAPLMFPEHSADSYSAAVRMGAGIVECDVTFTKDLALVCRHAQNDLHSTTNIVDTDLGASCFRPFTPATEGAPAQAECRTSDISLADYKTLIPKMDRVDKTATNSRAYLAGDVGHARIMTHADSIELLRAEGVKFAPELKSPAVSMPFNGLTQDAYAQKLVDAYVDAGIPASDVWLQSFHYRDIQYWIENKPAFGAQAVFLDNQYANPKFDNMAPTTWAYSMAQLKADGVNYLGPPMWMLVTVSDNKIVPSLYAKHAKAAGLKLIPWALERSGSLAHGGGWYYQTIKDVTDNEGVTYELLHVLAQDVVIEGIFSDWPATVTYYANCMGL